MSDELARLPPDLGLRRARTTPGSSGLAALFHAVHQAEIAASFHPHRCTPTPQVLPALVIDPATTLPLPTDDDWRAATQLDPDTHLLHHSLLHNTPLLRAQLTDKSYYDLFRAHHFELQDGIIHYYDEPRRARARQLRLRLVPISLRRVVISACHSSPFAGHSGTHRTYHRLTARFWWPGMNRDTLHAVQSCAHCRLANNTSHKAQAVLHDLPCDAPLDVIFLDVWSPGEVPEKSGDHSVLTYIDGMTGFAGAAFIREKPVTSTTLATIAFANFFVPFGMPRLVIVDADGLFAGAFLDMCHTLLIPVDAVSKENHKAVRNERFHRYLNKVQRLNTAAKESLHQWIQGTLFAVYAWNAGPIDGTDIGRSFAALGRDFPFPIDLALNPPPVRLPIEGNEALDHVDALFPLLCRQQDLLRLLNQERRICHRELRNGKVTNRVFEPGDLVIVRKQVKSRTSDGISAKLLFRAKGPYRVVGPAHQGSYRLLRLPFAEGLGRPGRIVKEAAFRMERLPSTLILHKCADGADTRLASLRSPLVANPLEKWLGSVTNGTYTKSNPAANWAFDRLADLWAENLDPGGDSDDDANDGPPPPPYNNADAAADPTNKQPTDSENEDDSDHDSDDDDNDDNTTWHNPPRRPTTAHLPYALDPPVLAPDTPIVRQSDRARARSLGRADRRALHTLYDSIMTPSCGLATVCSSSATSCHRIHRLVGTSSRSTSTLPLLTWPKPWEATSHAGTPPTPRTDSRNLSLTAASGQTSAAPVTHMTFDASHTYLPAKSISTYAPTQEQNGWRPRSNSPQTV